MLHWLHLGANTTLWCLTVPLGGLSPPRLGLGCDSSLTVPVTNAKHWSHLGLGCDSSLTVPNKPLRNTETACARLEVEAAEVCINQHAVGRVAHDTVIGRLPDTRSRRDARPVTRRRVRTRSHVATELEKLHTAECTRGGDNRLAHVPEEEETTRDIVETTGICRGKRRDCYVRGREVTRGRTRDIGSRGGCCILVEHSQRNDVVGGRNREEILAIRRNLLEETCNGGHLSIPVGEKINLDPCRLANF